MALRPGSRVASYEILALIGSGGMGEVYRAHDLRLGRDVAIKVLPENLSRDPAALGRLEREARSASALNHPHIVQVYEVGSAPLEGSSETVRFVAMEYVEGQSLRQLIGGGESELRRNLEVLAAVGDALARAHSAGIVHRDIKPENIMVTRDGYAKIIDFGLAKLAEPAGPLAGDGKGDQVTAQRLTTEGTILGTIGYVSPEQVQGREADHRSDVFSLGCVLFEAITGAPPFQKPSLIATLHAIVHDPTPSLSTSIPTIPGELQWIVRKCMAKDPAERYQSASEVAIDLREVKRQIDSGGASFSRTLVLGTRRSSKKMWVVLAIVVIAAAGIGTGIVLRGKRPAAPAAAAPSPPAREMKIRRITQTGNAVAAAISPDGRYVAYVIDEQGKQSLWLRQLATSTDIEKVQPAAIGLSSLSFSGDGSYLRYVAANPGDDTVTLYQVPILGGESRKVTGLDIPAPGAFVRIGVSPDGRHIAFLRGEDLVLRDVGTNHDRIVMQRSRIEAVSWSADGQKIAAGGSDVEGQWHSEILLIDPFTGKRTPFAAPRWRAFSQVEFQPKGGVIVIAHPKTVVARGQLWAIPPAPAAARRITNDLANYTSISLSAEGHSLAALQEENDSDIWIYAATNLDAGRRMTRGAGATRMSWTPDEKIIYDSTLDESLDLWMVDMNGRQEKIVADERSNYTPSISADGRFMIFGSTRSGSPQIWRADLDGRNPRALTSGPRDYLPEMMPDGQTFLYWQIDNKHTFRKPLAGGNPTELAGTPSEGCIPSGDGKRLACSNWELRTQIAILNAGDGTTERILRTPDGDGFTLSWSPGDKAIETIVETNGVQNLWRQPIDGTAPRRLTNFTSGTIDSYKWSRDGSKLAICRGTERRDVVLITDY